MAACQVSVPDKDGLITGAPWSGELELPSPAPAVSAAQALLELSWIRVAEALNLRRSSIRSECSAAASCVALPVQKPTRWAGSWASGRAKPASARHGWGRRGGDPKATPVPPQRGRGAAPGQQRNLCVRCQPAPSPPSAAKGAGFEPRCCSEEGPHRPAVGTCRHNLRKSFFFLFSLPDLAAG